MQDEPPIRQVAGQRRVELVDPVQRDGGGRVDLATVWRLLAPWLGYLLLAAAAVFGLFVASEAVDAADYDAGMATFALALCLTALRIKRHLDGGDDALLFSLTASDEDGLLLTVALLGVLGVAGLVLAAATESVFHEVGIALFLVCAALIFWNVKRYFDRREGKRPPFE